MNDDNTENPGAGQGQYASPPCSMHELDSTYAGASPGDPQQRTDVARWRKAERRRQIDLRLAMDRDLRRRHTARLATLLEEAIGAVEGLTVGAYWPMRGEPDLHGFIERIAERGGRCALPVVAERRGVLAFRAWTPGEALEKDAWDIPVPADGAEVEPDVLIAPVVAFDGACYRLGYGGGHFDRTLAAIAYEPRVFGVGFAHAAVTTIYPQPHDIPMGAIVTEQGVLRP